MKKMLATGSLALALMFDCNVSTFAQKPADHKAPVASVEKASGPFGFEKGMSRAQVEALGIKLTHQRGPMFMATMAPKNHRSFDTYVLIFAEGQGLLKVIAMGKMIRTGDAGYEVQTKFREIVDGVSYKYGQPSIADYCNGGTGCSDNSSMWMLALLEKNRNLSVTWEPNVNDVAGVVVEAIALRLNEGYIVATFEFSGWEAYVDSVNAKEDTSY